MDSELRALPGGNACEYLVGGRRDGRACARPLDHRLALGFALRQEGLTDTVPAAPTGRPFDFLWPNEARGATIHQS